MHIKQLKKNVGKVFRLWPVPLSRTWSYLPQRIPQEYNVWRLEVVLEKQRRIELYSPQGYRLRLGFDHIYGHTTPDILQLWSRVVIHGPKVNVVPLRSGTKAFLRRVSLNGNPLTKGDRS